MLALIIKPKYTMKKTGLILTGLFFVSFTFGQTVNFQVGTSMSHLDWKINGTTVGSLYNKTLIGYSILAGIDYLDKKYFNLSSNIGFIRKGGKDEAQLYDQNGVLTSGTLINKATLDYFSINTKVDIKYEIKETFTPFVGIGPQFGYLINNSKLFEAIKKNDRLENKSYGLLVGGGIKYNRSKFQLGLRADYYLDFTKVADWTVEAPKVGSKITSKTYSISFTIGYKLK